MLKEQICKVCNTPAPEDSPQYAFMMSRLRDYLESQSPAIDEEEPEKLFEFDYTTRLVNLSNSHEDGLLGVRDTKNKIKELFEFNGDRRKELEEFAEKLEIEKNNRERIIGNSSIGASKLTDVLKNYNAWQDYLTGLNKEVVQYDKDLEQLSHWLKEKKAEKEDIDLQSASAFLIKTRAIFETIRSKQKC